MKVVAIAVGLLLAGTGIVFAKSSKKPVVINMKAMSIIESSGNAGAFNKKTNAIGLYQITPICLADYNLFHTHKFKMNDMFNADKNTAVADWYLNRRIPQLLKHFRIADTIENRIIAWNAGIRFLLESIPLVPKETKEFINKYRRLTNGHKDIVG